jgi:lipopolysaccharide biosynthesis glycosyltransferase
MTAHLAFCIDQAFAPHLGALLQSLQATQPAYQFHFHVLTGGLANDNTQALNNAVSGSHKITLYNVDTKTVNALPLSDRFADRLSAATYYRLLLPDLLPDEVEKVLYLDADMIVRGDIEPLLSIDLTHNVAAVVADISHSRGSLPSDIGMRNSEYFNAGMLLINLPAWRQQQISQRCLSLLAGERVWPCNDQDVLNIVLEEQCIFVESIWNWQLIKPQIQRYERSEPMIVHYNGAEKPWHHSSLLPYTEDYRLHKRNSTFCNDGLEFGLDQHDEQLIQLLNSKSPKTLVIYGAGIKGRRLAAFLRLNCPAISIKAMIDKDPQTDRFMQIPVIKASLYHGNDTILVASKAYATEITRYLLEKSCRDIITTAEVII